MAKKFTLTTVRLPPKEPIVISLEEERPAERSPDSTVGSVVKTEEVGTWESAGVMVAGKAEDRESVEGSSRRERQGTDCIIYLRANSTNFVLPTTFQRGVTYVFQTRKAEFALPKPGKTDISAADLFECLTRLSGNEMPKIPQGSLPEVALFRMTE